MERVRGHLPFNPHEGIGALVWVKVVGVGDSGVGKTCLVKRFCEEKFTPKFHPTVGVDTLYHSHFIAMHSSCLLKNAFYQSIYKEANYKNCVNQCYFFKTLESFSGYSSNNKNLS